MHLTSETLNQRVVAAMFPAHDAPVVERARQHEKELAGRSGATAASSKVLPFNKITHCRIPDVLTLLQVVYRYIKLCIYMIQKE